MVEPNIGVFFIVFIFTIIGFIKFLAVVIQQDTSCNNKKDYYIEGSEMKFCVSKKY